MTILGMGKAEKGSFSGDQQDLNKPGSPDPEQLRAVTRYHYPDIHRRACIRPIHSGATTEAGTQWHLTPPTAPTHGLCLSPMIMEKTRAGSLPVTFLYNCG